MRTAGWWLLFGIGTLIGIWAILGVLADVRGSLDVIKGASWGWGALAFVLAQLPVAAEAWALNGAVPGSAALQPVPRAGDIEDLHRAGWRGRRGVRAPGQVPPAQRARRGRRGQLRRHRADAKADPHPCRARPAAAWRACLISAPAEVRAASPSGDRREWP